jgi:hypothetical protein
MAGDWNMTVCTDSNDHNIDTLNMSAPPGLGRSRILADVCDSFSISDPYRCLHPHTRDYTFIPRSGKNNRSRLDFFLISDKLLFMVNSCSISLALDTTLFDHKSIFLSLRKPLKSLKNYINPKIFSHPRFESVVACAVTETYLHHADLDADPDLDVEAGLAEVGNLILKLREANELEFEIKFEGSSEENLLRLEGLNAEIRMLVDDLPGPDHLSDINLNCTNDIFLEVLTGNIRNALVAFQTWMKKIENCRISLITKKLNTLKTDYVTNQKEIFQLETVLTGIREENLELKVRNMKIFEHLHNERPSPLFLNLVKDRNVKKLSCVLGDKGESFPDDNARNEHIVKYFEKVYRKRKNGDNVNYESCIQDFLGPDILNHNVVRDSILTEDERRDLDLPLSLDELDKSMESANMKSAPGQDGFSNLLLKKVWKYIRIPLHKYALHCFDTGILTANFRSATIKLIPKKGDYSNLKNWRPISLLSNLYKILSRAITARLNKVNNRVCSRAQKGYNSQRYVQEVLINVCETIKYCKENGTRAGVLAVDMAKAFDTLDHRFIFQVYKFFGLGDNIIKWLQLCGNHRQACIMLDDQINSRYFSLESGRPQGDNISPITFNFCEQILIFKLELDPMVEKIPRAMRSRVAAVSPFRFESNRETACNESLADDNTVLTLLSRDSLQCIKNILLEFENISGLACNYDKTVLMPIQVPTEAEMDFIVDLGFRTTEKINLLGAEITPNLEDLSNNFLKIKEKISKLIRFWERFKLSLPGRISIAKTFLVSQLNYLGCVFQVPSVYLDEIQALIHNFIKKNLNISRERMTRPVELGGVGFFNLEEFLMSQKCSWIFRAHRSTIDNWRYDLYDAAPGNNILLLKRSDINRSIHPILYDIVTCYEKFYNVFVRCAANYEKSYIFCNDLFCRADNRSLLIDDKFFPRNFYLNNLNYIRTLKFIDCFRNGRFKSYEEWQAEIPELSINLWLGLRNAIMLFKNNNTIKQDNKSENISEFALSLKRGSRKIRKYFDYAKNSKLILKDVNTVKSFFQIVSHVPIKFEYLGDWISCWNFNPLTNDLKKFVFNCRFNSLPLNNRLHSFLKDIDPRCTFCRLGDPNTTERDSFRHCFFCAHLLETFSMDYSVDLTLKLTMNL